MAEVRITVLAGTNGSGKSSVGGELLRQAKSPFFNPDEVAKEVRQLYPDLSPGEANSRAWQEGLRQLQDAIQDPHDYAFETTLGGNTITDTLRQAIDAGLDVCIWYVGLTSPELHIARVKARVALGGHAIPEAKIRERFDSSRLNLVRLMPLVAELKVFDNSTERDPAQGLQPEPVLLLHVVNGKLVGPSQAELEQAPEWAKPLVAAAWNL